MRVGFIGLGAMGAAMASRLVEAGHEVQVWNRSPGPAAELERKGARRAKSPQDAFRGDAVVTMLANDEAVRAVILDGGALEKAPKGIVHVMTATISVALARELEEAHAAHRIDYVAAPVLGRPDVAAAGALNILVAGDPDAIRRIQPLLGAMGRATWPLGAEPHKANVAKIAMNFLLASAIEAMAEAVALAERHAVEPKKLMDVVTGTLFASPAYKIYGPAIVEQTFEPAGFKLALGLKDVRLALMAGEGAGAPMPFASVLHDNFVDAIAHGDGGRDWVAVAKVARRRAGLDEKRPQPEKAA
jgi:3-hydroxyisobutyrate dehydrogenase-like beta-hydroxyacid dehydrogenase